MNRKLQRWAILLMFPTFLWEGAARAQEAAAPDPTYVILRRAIPDPDESVREDLMMALRGLRDPALRPLLSGLATSTRSDLRRHGLLGLAELEDPPKLNLLSVSRLDDPVERAAIVGEAIRLKMIRPEALDALLEWRELDVFLELIVRGRMVVRGEDAGLDRVREHAEGTDSLRAAMALLVLAQAGEPELARHAALRVTSPEQSELERNGGVGILVEHLRRERFDATGLFFEHLYSLYVPTDKALSAELLAVWLQIAPIQAGSVWSERFAQAQDLSEKLRLVLGGLDAASDAEPSMFDLAVQDSSMLVRDLSRAAQAVALHDGALVLAMVDRLLDQQYDQAIAWCVSRLPEMMPELGPKVWALVIQRSLARNRGREPVSAVVPMTAEKFALADPDSAGASLNRARAHGDEKLCQALLVGLLRARSGPIWDQTSADEWPDPASAALALIAQAMASGSMEPEQIERLRGVARGRANLPEVFRVQAAWLAIRHAGDARGALARLLGEVDLSPS